MIRHIVLVAAIAPLLGAQTKPSSDRGLDPLAQLTASFPGSVHYRNSGRTLEFCPDNTCHGFSASHDVSKQSLRDFAFLYIYYFSDYYALPEWRAKEQAKNMATQVLSKPTYRNCRKETPRESAGCILLKLSDHGTIKLLFIRYDEGKRNVEQEAIREQVVGNGPPSP